jgi:hypothetical protein
VTAQKTAKIEQTLVEYDGPQVLLLKSSSKRHMIAVAVTRPGYEHAFFTVEISDKTYDKYFEGTADLHFVFKQAAGGSYFFFDEATATADNEVVLVKAKPGEVEDAALWPKVGFFSRSHTNSFNRAVRPTSLQCYSIDGKWGADDFSHFHGKMSDLYLTFAAIGRLDGTNAAAERDYLKDVIQDRLWRGGGSYVGFYGSLAARNRVVRSVPLEVSKIKYASPGEIELRGQKAALSSIAEIVDVFEEHSIEFGQRYRHIRRI